MAIFHGWSLDYLECDGLLMNFENHTQASSTGSVYIFLRKSVISTAAYKLHIDLGNRNHSSSLYDIVCSHWRQINFVFLVRASCGYIENDINSTVEVEGAVGKVFLNFQITMQHQFRSTPHYQWQFCCVVCFVCFFQLHYFQIWSVSIQSTGILQIESGKVLL